MANAKRQHCYDYPRPALTADVAVFTPLDDQLKLLLIRRKSDPFAGAWALPGGFVNEGERLLDAARRELEEETGVKGGTLHEFGAFGDPGRDPRGWTVTVAYLTLLAPDRVRTRAADDAAAVGWFPADDLPPLAFDHDIIIDRAVTALRREPLRALAESGCLPPRFTLPEIKDVLRVILGTAQDRSSPTDVLKRASHTLRESGNSRNGVKRYAFARPGATFP
jgi:8-oxo-dGTP diphosphatase